MDRAPPIGSFRSLIGNGVAGSVLAIGALSLALMIFGMAVNSSTLTYTGAAFLAPIIPMTASLLRGRNFDPFEPTTLIALTVFVGTSLRAVWLQTSSAAERVQFILMGTTLDQVAANVPWMLLSLVAFTVGYIVTPFRFKLERSRQVITYAMSRRRVELALSVSLIMAIIGVALLVRQYGISLTGDLAAQSVKRVQTFTNEGGEVVFGSGYEQFIAGAAQHGVALLAALLLSRMVRPNVRWLVWMGVLGFFAVLTPFLTSSRSQLVLVGLNILIFAFYYNRLKLRMILLCAALAVPIVATMGALRDQNTKTVMFDEGATAADRILGSGSSLDFIRTSAIMDRVPQVVEYQYGMTYLALLAAPIPRAIWADKPNVGLGGFVKSRIFGQQVRTNGWPSGMIAEGWINFGFPGLFVPLFLFGAMLRILYESCRPLLGVSFPITLLYSTTCYRLGFAMIALNFAHGITQALYYFAPLLVLVVIAAAPRSQRMRAFARRQGEAMGRIAPNRRLPLARTVNPYSSR